MDSGNLTGDELLVWLRWLRSNQTQAGVLAARFAKLAQEQGKTWEEIAEATGLTSSTVRHRVTRGQPLDMVQT